MKHDSSNPSQNSSNSVSRRKFLALGGISVASLGAGILDLGTLQSGFPGANLVSSNQIGANLVSVKQIVGIDPPRNEKGKGIYIDIEGDEFQRSGVWVRTKATTVDTVVGLFVENIGKGDGIYVENTDASSQASGIAVV